MTESMEPQKFVPDTPPTPVPTLDAGWKSLGIRQGFNPPPPEELRLFVAGRAGTGKSTFLASRPHSLILSFESSYDFVTHPLAAGVAVPTFAKFLSIMGKLEADAKNAIRPFTNVAFDVIDQFVALVDTHLTGEINVERLKKGYPPIDTVMDFGSHGAGVKKLREAVWKYLIQLTVWGYTWTAATHIVDKTQTSSTGAEYTSPQFSMFPTMAGMLVNQCDFCLQITNDRKQVISKQVVKEKKGGVITTRSGAMSTTILTHYLTGKQSEVDGAKTRVMLPDRVILPQAAGWEAFSSAYNAGIAEVRASKI